MSSPSSPIFRNSVTITHVHYSEDRQYAIGILMEKKPRTCYIPHWIIKAFHINTADQGFMFDCLFIEQEEGRDPMVVAIIEQESDLAQSEEVGSFTGSLGSAQLTMKLEDVPGADEIRKLASGGRPTLKLVGKE